MIDVLSKREDFRMKKTIVVLGLLIGFSVQALANGVEVYRIDKAHSTVGFSVKHLMITNVRGEFGDFDATVEYSPENLAASSVKATIKTTSIDTRNEKRDNHLRSPDFFEVEQFPEMSFTSKAFKKSADGRITVQGELTLHGITRDVTLDVEGPTPFIKDGRGNTRMGLVATTRLNRTDFGLNWNMVLEAGGLTVGEEVTVTLDLSLIQEKDTASE